MTVTQRSGLEQQLIVRSLERAIAQLDVQRFAGRRVTLDLFTLTDEQTQVFAEEYLFAQLQEQGLQVVPDGENTDLRLEIFASVLGVDQGTTLVGLPSVPTPVGFALPEIAAYKVDRNRGYTELQMYAFDARTHGFIAKTPVSLGRARYDRYKVLSVINFQLSDVEE